MRRTGMIDLRERLVRRGSQSIYTVACGDGPTVLMVHGFPETSTSWRSLMGEVAAAGHTAVAMDVLGYGKSSKPREVERYTLLELSRDIAAVIDAYGGPAVLIGHDWGAQQVYATALIHP